MSADDYLESLLRKYAVDPSAAVNAANLLTPLIRGWAGHSLLDIQFSGSYAKGTAISLGTDIDLFLSLDSNQPVKDLYWSLFHHCEKTLQRPQVQNVSLRVQSQGIDIDLVPGRKRPGPTTDHTLYRRNKDSWVQTNIAEHIRVVRASGRIAEIRALKIWRELHHLDFPSFYLELTVIAALNGNPLFGNSGGSRSASLAERVFSILGYLAQKFRGARVLDPANTNNVISDDLSIEEKRAIAVAAQKCVVMRSWEQILW
jgi:hypothetical protein